MASLSLVGAHFPDDASHHLVVPRPPPWDARPRPAGGPEGERRHDSRERTRTRGSREMIVHRIEIAATRANTYVMTYQGNGIGESRGPLCESARLLLARGLAKPADRIEIARGGKVALTATVGWAAAHVASEGDEKAPHWRKWSLHPDAVCRAGAEQRRSVRSTRLGMVRQETRAVLAAR
jgi:hypothetical protein